ncbi:MAG: hypothetical protein KDA94_11015 [Acidimicrobiales bacterium]|nr:hypothetical protein [Acidimicrobiales bacterium]
MKDVKKRRKGTTRISSQHQVTIPAKAFADAGFVEGEVLSVRHAGPGRVVLERRRDPIAEFAGAMSGTWTAGELDELRDEWE